MVDGAHPSTPARLRGLPAFTFRGRAEAPSLAEALSGCFAVEDSPIWADGSTEAYAAELEEAMGGAARLAQLTGSRAHLRQGAPQIMKVSFASSVTNIDRGVCAWARSCLPT